MFVVPPLGIARASATRRRSDHGQKRGCLEICQKAAISANHIDQQKK
jgi:hypothetical protein